MLGRLEVGPLVTRHGCILERPAESAVVGARRAPRSAASSPTQQFSLWPGNWQAEGETGRARSCGDPAPGGRDGGRLLHCLHSVNCLAGVVAYGLQWRVAAAQIEFGEPANLAATQTRHHHCGGQLDGTGDNETVSRATHRPST